MVVGFQAHERNASPVAYASDGSKGSGPNHRGVGRHKPTSNRKLVEEARAKGQQGTVDNGESLGRLHVRAAHDVEQPKRPNDGNYRRPRTTTVVETIVESKFLPEPINVCRDPCVPLVVGVTGYDCVVVGVGGGVRTVALI